MIAVILAAGKGSRMGLEQAKESKCMLSVEGEPVLGKKVRELAALSCVEKIILVVRKEDDRIREELGSSTDHVPIVYAIQEEGHPGLVNALYSVPDYETWAGQTILLNLGDEYYRSLDYQELAARHRREGAELTLVLTPTADRSKVCRNYTVDLAEDGRVLHAVEKPDRPFNSYMGCGTLVMEGDFLVRYAHEAENSCPEGGYEGQNLTDWIQRALQEGRCCRTYLYEDMYCNLNTREDYLYLRAFAGEERIREFICREGSLGLVPGKGSRISQDEIRDRLLEVVAEYEFPPRIFLACDG